VGLPLPDVRVRIAELKTGNAGKTYYDVFANGNSKATNVVPGRVINIHEFIFTRVYE